MTKDNKPAPIVAQYTAKCGHVDPLGYFTNLPCGKCVRKAHKKAVGK
jgi:hypothetical protein